MAILKMKKYRVKAWYRKLPDDEKRMVRSQFCATFTVNARQFYYALSSNSLSGEQLEFFSIVSGHTINDLIAVSLEIRSYEPVDLEAEARKLGLSK